MKPREAFFRQFGERFTARVPATGTLAVGGTTNVNLIGFINHALLKAIYITSDPDNKSTDFDAEIFETDAFADAGSIYLNETNNHKIRDNFVTPVPYRDRDETSKMHLKIDNNAGSASFFTVDIRYIPEPLPQTGAVSTVRPATVNPISVTLSGDEIDVPAPSDATQSSFI